MLGCGSGLAVVMATFKYTSGFVPKRTETKEEEIERRERMKKNRRRPIEETIEELGEGRGELCQISSIQGISNSFDRNLCSWLGGAEEGALEGEVWH